MAFLASRVRQVVAMPGADRPTAQARTGCRQLLPSSGYSSFSGLGGLWTMINLQAPL
jgi:hypothetical protein